MSNLSWGVDLSVAPPPVLASKEPIIRFFSYHDAHPIALTMALIKAFGVEWFEWEPETLNREIIDKTKATAVSEHNWQKIQAVRTLTSTIGCWEEWHIFEKIIQALNNNVPRFDICQVCSLPQLMAGVDIIDSLRKRDFGEEIQKYVAACAINAGVIHLPEPLEFSHEWLSRPMYACRDCGRIDTDDQGDGKCDTCCGRFNHERPLSLKPHPDVPADAGRNVELFLLRDAAPVKERLKYVMDKGIENVDLDDESPEDVQSLKLYTAIHYMKNRRGQLEEQLKEINQWTLD